MPYVPVPIFQGALSTTLTTTLATVTTGKTWVVTDIEICNTGTSIRAVTIALRGSGAGKRIFSALSINPNQTIQWQGKQVLLSTETITGGQDAGTDVTVTIAGAEG
jgi:hypothetical protein